MDKPRFGSLSRVLNIQSDRSFILYLRAFELAFVRFQYHSMDRKWRIVDQRFSLYATLASPNIYPSILHAHP